MDLYGGQMVTAEVELSLHFKTRWVPLQYCSITAAGVHVLTRKQKKRCYVKFILHIWHAFLRLPSPLIVNQLAVTISAPVIIPGVHWEASHFMSVISQLFIAGHAESVDDVDDRVLRTDPHLLLDQSNHAGLHRRRCDIKSQFWHIQKMLADTKNTWVFSIVCLNTVEMHGKDVNHVF